MKDIDNNEIKVGDRVATIEPGYRKLTLAYITKITPKGMNLISKGKEWAGCSNRPISNTVKVEQKDLTLFYVEMGHREFENIVDGPKGYFEKMIPNVTFFGYDHDTKRVYLEGSNLIIGDEYLKEVF